MKKILILLTVALIGALTLSAQNDSTRKQKKQKRKSKTDSTQQHWQGNGKNWPADIIHHMINGKDSVNKF